MTQQSAQFDGLELGYDIPALPGLPEAEIRTPCLILDLDALERNITRMGQRAAAAGMRHRAHGKMHKSVDVYRLQERLGGASGICCQKVSEAEVFARAGVVDILVSNQVRGAGPVDRLARLPQFGGRIATCVDDIANVVELGAAARRHGTQIDCLVELDCGARRCGVADGPAAVTLARAIASEPGLRFAGLQAYQGSLQHVEDHAERRTMAEAAIALTRDTVAALNAAGFTCDLVTGAGTGSWAFEAASGVYNELQCGSYAFMDADYGRIRDADGIRLDQAEWENALFLLTSVMSHPTPHRAVVDAGLKAQSLDSGLPLVFGDPDLRYVQCSDEHGIVEDPQARLQVGDRLRLVPGHCDPTCNLHDWYVGIRNGTVEAVWPVSARGKLW